MNTLRLIDPRFDATDGTILAARSTTWATIPGPRVGDWCIMEDGEYRRFTHDWGNALQVTCKGQAGSFYFGNGGVSYSGGLDPGISKRRLEFTGNLKPAPFWFFHHDYSRAHNGVHFETFARVYRVTGL